MHVGLLSLKHFGHLQHSFLTKYMQLPGTDKNFKGILQSLGPLPLDRHLTLCVAKFANYFIEEYLDFNISTN